ncbi:neutral and basic amino acid transport protein rBAT-like protein [Leptotrombidium deliense]|uniref:Neutral and basic amino acid transport protein rBAT-like protein n=1 Tax=Leptotrombidium deliense TaxID=299467 RepID=A0A443S8U4_9ACAR|nr:neutral and basic amino acid transport protein rBAT-like protein [Leptotrombidium deliense]
MSRNKAELFVDTDLNYVPFIETPEKYTPQETTIYYFDSEKSANEFAHYVITDDGTGLYNPIANCSSSKSSSTASDACSSTRLLDGITDVPRVAGSMKTSVSEVCFENTPMTVDYRSKAPVVNGDFEYTIWTKIQSSMTSSLRSKYLSKTRNGNRSGFVWRSCSGITSNKLSLLLLVTMLVCAFIVVVIAVLTVNSYNSVRVVKSDANTNDQYSNCSDEWWKSAIFYEIFPASFKDSDGDGFGDIDGIREQLAYIRDLGVTAVRLNSIFSALDYPYQYEHIIDFRNIDPHIGTLHSFKALVREIHKQRMFVVLDINPTITSDQHPWAAHWLINNTGKYSDYYVYSKQR